MKRNTLKLGITIIAIALFASCKTSSETESNNKQTQSKTSITQRSKGGQPSVANLLTQMDSNKDGKLSKDEVKGPLANDFSKIDKDEDGFLSEEELKNAPKPERQGGGQGRPQRGQ